MDRVAELESLLGAEGGGFGIGDALHDARQVGVDLLAGGFGESSEDTRGVATVPPQHRPGVGFLQFGDLLSVQIIDLHCGERVVHRAESGSRWRSTAGTWVIS